MDNNDALSCIDPAREEMEAEFGAFPNEFAAAYTLSQMEAPSDDRGEIRRAVAMGFFVVVASTPRYCRLTDALLGEHLSFISKHMTREEADAACPESNEDVSYDVRGPKADHAAADAREDEAYARAAARHDLDEEIPF